ncbi:MAG: sigma-70 family RNA polymerase sigma factor [Gammaproteobacteria bacterium]|nr:sigma-70 family RNA polymerase sigma factor [Gammaproteobacteria bacterium]
MNGHITQLIQDARQGDRNALDELMPLIHDELRLAASRHLRSERPGHTLDTGALVNEAYLRLAQQNRASWQDRAHFLAVASMIMRRVLVNHAKQRKRLKRGNGAEHLTLSHADTFLANPALGETPNVDIEALDEALNRLADIDARAARVVECRYFAGLKIDETAEALNISPATVKRQWLLAKTWLRREIRQ